MHADDLTGHLRSGDWAQLKLPAINDKCRTLALSPTRMHTWRAGELLHPERDGHDVLARERATIAIAQRLHPYDLASQLIETDITTRRGADIGQELAESAGRLKVRELFAIIVF